MTPLTRTPLAARMRVWETDISADNSMELLGYVLLFIVGACVWGNLLAEVCGAPLLPHACAACAPFLATSPLHSMGALGSDSD